MGSQPSRARSSFRNAIAPQREVGFTIADDEFEAAGIDLEPVLPALVLDRPREHRLPERMIRPAELEDRLERRAPQRRVRQHRDQLQRRRQRDRRRTGRDWASRAAA